MKFRISFYNLINNITELRQLTPYNNSKADPGTPSTFLETQREIFSKTMLEML